MIQNGDQKVFIEFESMRKLFANLPDTINELQEHWRSISIWMVAITMSNSLLEFVTKTEPFLLNQDFKAF